MLVGQRLAAAAAAHPDRAALLAGGERWSYGRFWTAVRRCAAGFRRLGLEPGERVALRLPNSPAYLVAFFAAAVGGWVAVTGEGAEGGLVLERPEDLPLGPEVQLSPPAPEETFYIGYTSGSTGKPKGVVRSHRAWAESFVIADRVFGLGPDDRLLITGRFVFSANLFFACEILEAGGTLLLNRCAEATAVFAVPSLLRVLPPMVRLRRIITCGEKLCPELRGELGARFPAARVFEFYGSSEMGFISQAGPQDPPDSVGRPFPCVEVTVRDGLLYARSRFAASGYADGTAFTDSDGWICSGDMARLDPQGYIYLEDRADELINTGGAKLHPAEVEAVLTSHPAVAEAAVFSVPNARRGQQVVAALAPRGAERPAYRELRAHCARLLPAYKCPRRYVWLEHLPRNPAGKVARAELRKLSL